MKKITSIFIAYDDNSFDALTPSNAHAEPSTNWMNWVAPNTEEADCAQGGGLDELFGDSDLINSDDDDNGFCDECSNFDCCHKFGVH